jgi:hypothetical protein
VSRLFALSDNVFLEHEIWFLGRKPFELLRMFKILGELLHDSCCRGEFRVNELVENQKGRYSVRVVEGARTKLRWSATPT